MVDKKIDQILPMDVIRSTAMNYMCTVSLSLIKLIQLLHK